ncbi:MAG: carboxymuconolactone decarboxylase family protein [Rhodospirillaceae bacterium]|nr:MAG: carboxymuconolactone decarboxylase family protein [Rhodospirillaceae bacterium]
MPNNTPRQGAVESESAFDMQAREAYITGLPPRIKPLQQNELGKDAIDAVNNIRKVISLPPTDTVEEYTATMLRHPALYQRHTELAIQLFSGALSARDRELAVLRIGWLSKAPYEWGEHVKAGKRMAGLTSEEIDRAKQGSTAPGWDEHERAIIRAVEELIADAMISDETWAVLSRRLDEKQLIELPLLVGQYQGVAYLQNALRLRLMPDNPGLSAR